MSDSLTTAAPEATNAASIAHIPVREHQVESEVDRSQIAGQRIMRSMGAGSPATPPEQFTGVSGGSSGLWRQMQRGYGNSYVGQVIQRKCEDCEKKEIQRKGEGDLSSVPEGFEATMERSGAGQPLDDGTRSFMESRFGQDFGDVRVHTDSAAAEASKQIQAQAFTTGRDIYFGRGRYQPQSTDGKKLVAHELTHVLQQTGEIQAKLIVGQSHDAYEQEAESVANKITHSDFAVSNTYSFISHGVIQRQDSSDQPADAGAPAGVPAVTSNPSSPPVLGGSTTAVEGFNPCSINETTFTNEEFVAMFQRVNNYLTSHRRGEEDYYAYAHLMRRLFAERRNRINSGHLWLASNPSSIPEQLYQFIATGPTTISVSKVDISQVQGAPAVMGNPVMTPAQFESFLERMNIPQVNFQDSFAQLAPNVCQTVSISIPPEAIAARLQGTQPVEPLNFLNPGSTMLGFAPVLPAMSGSGIYNSPFGLAAGSRFSSPMQDVGSWRGPLAETSFMASRGYGLPFVDLDRRYETVRQMYGSNYNFPIYDAISRFGPKGSRRVFSVGTMDNPTMSTPVSTLPDFARGKYSQGFRDMTGSGTTSQSARQFAEVIIDLNALLEVDFSRSQLINQSYLAVNSDHVVSYRDHLSRDLVSNPQNYRGFIDNYLAENPITLNGVEYRSIEPLIQATRGRNRTVRIQDMQTALRPISALAGNHVISNGISTSELRNLISYRSQFNSVDPMSFRAIVAPELIDAVRLGITTAPGESFAAPTPEAISEASNLSGKRGAAVGGVISGGLSLYQLLADPHNQPLSQRITHSFTDTAMGAGGGYITASAESRLNIMAGQYLLERSETSAATSLLTQGERIGVGTLAAGLGSRVFISTGVGAVVAPATTAISMMVDDALFDAQHTSSDYASQTSRAAVSGGLAAGSGALATAGYGALMGTEAGPVGMLIGFGVGLLVYMVADNTVGEEVESSIRESMEAGCPR
jgi:hypothetical protein